MTDDNLMISPDREALLAELSTLISARLMKSVAANTDAQIANLLAACKAQRERFRQAGFEDAADSQ